MELHKKRKKAKFLKALERGSTLLAQRLVTWYSSIFELVRESGSIITYLIAYRTAALLLSLLSYLTLFFPFTLLPFLFTLLFLPSCLVKINLNSVPAFFHWKYSKTSLNLVFARFQLPLIENIPRQFQIVS